MPEICSLIWLALVGAFRSRASLEAENTILRHHLIALRWKSPKRPTFGMLDRLKFAGLYRLVPKVLSALAIVKPETVIKWHRAGFRSYWRWKSRRRVGALQAAGHCANADTIAHCEAAHPARYRRAGGGTMSSISSRSFRTMVQQACLAPTSATPNSTTLRSNTS